MGGFLGCFIGGVFFFLEVGGYLLKFMICCLDFFGVWGFFSFGSEVQFR